MKTMAKSGIIQFYSFKIPGREILQCCIQQIKLVLPTLCLECVVFYTVSMYLMCLIKYKKINKKKQERERTLIIKMTINQIAVSL